MSSRASSKSPHATASRIRCASSSRDDGVTPGRWALRPTGAPFSMVPPARGAPDASGSGSRGAGIAGACDSMRPLQPGASSRVIFGVQVVVSPSGRVVLDFVPPHSRLSNLVERLWNQLTTTSRATTGTKRSNRSRTSSREPSPEADPSESAHRPQGVTSSARHARLPARPRLRSLPEARAGGDAVTLVPRSTEGGPDGAHGAEERRGWMKDTTSVPARCVSLRRASATDDEALQAAAIVAQDRLAEPELDVVPVSTRGDHVTVLITRGALEDPTAALLRPSSTGFSRSSASSPGRRRRRRADAPHAHGMAVDVAEPPRSRRQQRGAPQRSGPGRRA